MLHRCVKNSHGVLRRQNEHQFDLVNKSDMAQHAVNARYA